MVGCMVLHHKTITNSTKIMLLRALFHEEDFEIHSDSSHRVTIYLWNVKKAAILEAVSLFESELIDTGAGFGKYQHEALIGAQQMLH